MQVSQIRAARWAITGGLAAFLAIAAAGFPTQAHAFVCNGQFDLLEKGYCLTTATQGCSTSFDAACPAGEGCKVEFGLRVVHQEPAGSDATPQIVEEAAGYIQGQGDAVCNEGLTGSLQSGSTQTANMPICPTCTIDQCNLGCDEQVTGMCQAQTASTPCADTDGNSCTTAGCELSPSDST